MGLLSKILGGAAVLAFALAAVLFFRLSIVEGQRDTARAERDTAISVAEANEATIQSLLAETERLDALLIRADERERGIREDARRNRQALQSVAGENPDVEDYLSEPVPDALRGLLNASPADADGDG